MSLADLSKGERFKELIGLVVKKAFDPKIGEPKNGQPGKLRQGLVLTDGTAEMGFTLWGVDVGKVMAGDQLTLRNGWVNAYDSKRGEKLDLRLRKEGNWAKTGSGADIPQVPTPKPEPQDVPVEDPSAVPPQPQWQRPSPAAQVMLTEISAREANINRQSARRDALQFWAGNEVTEDDVLTTARQFYRWAMNFGPHWMDDETARKRFWAKLGEAGLDSKDAHRELNVYSMYDFEGTEQDALDILILGGRAGKPLEPDWDIGGDDSPPKSPGTSRGSTGSKAFPAEKISTAGEFFGAIYNNLGYNKTKILALLGVADHAEIQGTTFQDKYQAAARAVAAAS